MTDIIVLKNKTDEITQLLRIETFSKYKSKLEMPNRICVSGKILKRSN